MPREGRGRGQNVIHKWADVDMGTVSQKYQKIVDVLYEWPHIFKQSAPMYIG